MGLARGSTAEDILAAHMRLAGLPVPDREYTFAKGIGRRWRFDFAWPAYMVAVEVEGGSYTGGRHVRPLGFRQDIEKYAHAVMAGWQLLRLTPEIIKSGEALEWVETVMRRQGWGR